MTGQAKVALTTGASRGIGRATLMQLATQGYYVVGTATTKAGADKITQALKDVSLTGAGMELNVNSLQSMEDLFANMKASCGMPDVLVNNAGVNRDNLLMRMSEEEWHNVIEANLTAIFRLSKRCIRHMMKSRWGRIITVGSVVGTSGNPGQTNYCAAKAGLIGFSKALAKEVASRNITVNVVAPGFIATDMTDALPEAQKQQLLTHIPAGHIGRPEDVARAIDFLASANYITGETLHVNGGLYLA